MKRMLMVGSTASMIKQFNMRNIDILQALDCEVIVAANFTKPGSISLDASAEFKDSLEKKGIIVFDIPFGRKMGTLKENILACKMLNDIIHERKLDFIHVHSALASVLTRFVAAINHIPVIYTVHGFQFMRGGSLKRWIAFFPVEWILAFFTKIVITINKEDYALVKRYFPAETQVINGVGIDIGKFQQGTIQDNILDELNINENDTVFLTVAELSNRKNQKAAIEAFSKIHSSDWKYILIGLGDELKTLKETVNKLGLQNNVVFLGYQENVTKYLDIADFCLYTSKLEGLLTAGMESLASGTPIIGSSVRGVRDLIIDDENGMVIPKLTVNHISKTIEKAMKMSEKEKMRMRYNSLNSAKQYSQTIIDDNMRTTYKRVLD